MSVYIDNCSKDPDMVEIYSNDKRGKLILWGVVHKDMLSYLNINENTLDYCEVELKADIGDKPF